MRDRERKRGREMTEKVAERGEGRQTGRYRATVAIKKAFFNTLPTSGVSLGQLCVRKYTETRLKCWFLKMQRFELKVKEKLLLVAPL